MPIDILKSIQYSVASLLQVSEEQLSPDLPLTQLGLESISALQLQSLIWQEFGVQLPLLFFLGETTLQTLVERVVQEQRAHQVATLLTAEPEQRYEPFPLTEIQQAYWVGRQRGFVLGNVATHFYQEYEREGLDIERLEYAWNRLVAQHDMLRTVIQPDGMQRVLKETQVPLYHFRVYDMRDEALQEQQLQDVRNELSHQQFITEAWPCFDIRLSRLTERRYRIHLSFDALFLDLTSFFLLMRQWSQLYQQPDLMLPTAAITFRDYVHFLEQERLTERYQRAEAYWTERIATLPPGPELPYCKAFSAVEQPHFTRRAEVLERERWQRLKALSAGYGITPSATLLAAFAALLQRWSRSPALTLNVTLFHRPAVHPDLEQLIGDFTSTSLLAVETNTEDFASFARIVNRQLWQDLEQSSFSGVSVQRRLVQQRDDLFTIATPIVFTSGLHTPQFLDGPFPTQWLGEQIYAISQTPQVVLDHQVFERDGALFFHWDAQEEVFPPGFLDRMFTCYCALLIALADDEAYWQQKQLPLLPDEDRELQEQANQTQGVLPHHLLQQPFFEQAQRFPHRPALYTMRGTVSYTQLALRARQLAAHLRQEGVRSGDLVAIVLPAGPEQIASTLAVLAASAVYVPLDAQWPALRLQQVLLQAEISTVLTTETLVTALSWPEGIRVLATETLPVSESVPVLPDERTPQDLAYIIYTSGSTGTPKGVMITHEGAVNTIHDISTRFAVGPDDRIFALSSLSFDLSVYDIFGLLGAGGALVLPEPELRRDPAHWLELIQRHRVTIWNSAPALMEMLLMYAEIRAEEVRRALQSVRLVLLSGDWIALSLPQRLRALAPQAQIISLGGATEGSIWSIAYPITDVHPDWKSIPYGRALRNQHMWVLNKQLEPCPVDVPGHIYIGGAGVALGYWKDEARTQERFLVHPETGERLYWTGDMGVWRREGYIEFLGRDDHQIKLRGHRVELGEIEAVLKRHAEVIQAVVDAPKTRDGQRRLVAYVQSEGPWEEVHAQLKSHARQYLPEYMLPLQYVAVQHWPVTANGKLDRKALPDPFSGSKMEAKRISARTAPGAERILAVIRRALKLPHFDAERSFLALGATSLQLIQVANALEHELQLRLPIIELVEAPSLMALAHTYVERLTNSHSSSVRSGPGIPLLQDVPEEVYPAPLSLSGLSRWWQLLREAIPEAVQLHISLPEDTGDGICAGSYLYDATTHALCPLQEKVNVPQRDCSFAIYFVASEAHHTTRALMEVGRWTERMQRTALQLGWRVDEPDELPDQSPLLHALFVYTENVVSDAWEEGSL